MPRISRTEAITPTEPDDATPATDAGRWMNSHARRMLQHGPWLGTPRAPQWGGRPWPSRLLHRLGEASAHSWAGVSAAIAVASWGVVGVFVGFAAWWQTALYSVTAAVTFVMVFVLQHTQARQTQAMQRKLDELVRSGIRADDSLIAIEEALDEDLQALADQALAERQHQLDAG